MIFVKSSLIICLTDFSPQLMAYMKAIGGWPYATIFSNKNMADAVTKKKHADNSLDVSCLYPS